MLANSASVLMACREARWHADDCAEHAAEHEVAGAARIPHARPQQPMQGKFGKLIHVSHQAIIAETLLLFAISKHHMCTQDQSGGERMH